MIASLFARKSRAALTIAALAAAGAASTAHATFPGDNGAIVFENPYMSAIGRVLMGGPVEYLQYGHSPSVSPSGLKIAYDFAGNIRVMNIYGGDDVVLTTTGEDKSPVWTPDGKSIVFTRSSNSIWKMDADGRNQVQLQSTPAELIISNALYPSGPDLLQAQAAIIDGVPGTQFQTSAGQFLVDFYASNPSYAPEGRSILLNRRSATAYEYTFASNAYTPIPADDSTGQNVASPDGKFLAAPVGPSNLQKLQVRPRAGGSGVESWSEPVKTLDWGRQPKNCYTTDSSGGHMGVLGGDVNSYVGQCAVVNMPDGGSMSGGVVMQAVTVGVDQRLYLGTAKLVGGLPVWTFSPAPGAGNANGIRVKKAAIAGAKDGSSEIVVIGADDDLLYHSVRAANGNWQATGFVRLAGAGGATTFKARDVAIAINGSSSTSPGNLQVVASAFDAGSVYHTVRWSGGGWSGFALVPASGGLNTRSLAIAADEYGAIYVVAAVTLANGTVQLVQQARHVDGSWNPSFTTVAVQPGVALSSASNSVALTSTLDGGVDMLYADATGGAWLQFRVNPNNSYSWSQPTVNTELVTSNVRSVSISAPPSGHGPSQIFLTRTAKY